MEEVEVERETGIEIERELRVLLRDVLRALFGDSCILLCVLKYPLSCKRTAASA